jgi:hypothetical protein
LEAQAHLKACVGCAAMVPDIDGPTHRYIGASPGCWALYGELAEKEAGDFRYMRSHRLTVDAYCAQHPGGALPAGGALGSGAPRRPALPAGARSARREVVRRSPAGCDARQARYKLGPRWLEVPASLGAVTVLDLLAVAAKDPAEHARGARGWAESVWEAWMAHQEVVRRWAAHPAR